MSRREPEEAKMNRPNTELKIRIYGVDGSLTSFTQDDPALAQRIIRDAQRPDFFRQDRITIAGGHSVTTLVVGRIARVDLAGEELSSWKHSSKVPASLREVVEVPEQEFLYQVEARDLNHLERRQQQHRPGQAELGFVDVHLVGGHHIYLQFKMVALLPAERLQRVHSILTLPGLSFRLAGGGVGIANLTNAVKFTGYPGPPEVPADAWLAKEGANQETSTCNLQKQPRQVETQ
jgi:hypothetical protein